MPPTGLKTYTLKDLKNADVPLDVMDERDRALVRQAVANMLAIHNEAFRESFSLYASLTTEKVEGANAAFDTLKPRKVDDLALIETRGGMDTPYQVGYPLDTWQVALGWSADYLSGATPNALAIDIEKAMDAHVLEMWTELRRAMYRPTNYTFRSNRKQDRTPIGVKALRNGDGEIPAMSWTGGTFLGTHNHYLAANNVTGALLEAIIMNGVNTVEEHSRGNRTMISISTLDETKIKGMPGFLAAAAPGIILATNANQIETRLDISQTDDRIIGSLNGRVIMTKVWAVAGYVGIVNTGAENKPFKMREPLNERERGLRLKATNILYPLQADYWEFSFGFGAYNRDAAAVVDLVNAVYTSPTIN